MANRAKRPCAKPGCPGLVDPPERYCSDHAAYGAAKQQEHDNWRGTSCSRGYDRAWRAVAALALRRDCGTCQYCLARKIVSTATEVHHIKPVAEYPLLRLVLSNLVSLCHPCHQAETAKEQHAALPTRTPVLSCGFF